MEQQNISIPSPSRPDPLSPHTKRSPATGYRKRSRSRGPKIRIDDKPKKCGDTQLGNASEAVPRTIKPTRFPLLDGSPGRGEGLRKEKFNAASDEKQKNTEHGRPGPAGTSSDGRYYKNHEPHSPKPQRQFEETPSPPSDNKGWYKDSVNGAYRKIMALAGSPRGRNVKYKGKPGNGTATEDMAVSPSVTSYSTGSSGDDPARQRVSPVPWQPKGDQGTSSDVKGPGRQKSCGSADNSTDSSAQCSISPMSTQSSSATDWEDRFVVNMPSAKEPNPPAMSTRQMPEFQSSIDNVSRDGEMKLDRETSPSPRCVTPEEKPGLFSPQHHQKWMSPTRFFSPEEVGKPRCSVIREESPPAPKAEAHGANLDGSFLGCKVMNGRGDKNPDEILLFSPRGEDQKMADATPIPQASGGLMEPNASRDMEERPAMQVEHGATSPNSRNVPCSKSSPMENHDMKGQQPANPEISNENPGKENNQPSSIQGNQEDPKNSHMGDDVYIITPTIRRTMITVGYQEGNQEGNSRSSPGIRRRPLRKPGDALPEARRKRQMGSVPSGLQPRIQNSQGKSTMPSKVSSETDLIGSIPAVKNEVNRARANMENANATRGYIHMPGMVKSSTENFAGGMRSNALPPLRPAARREGQDAAPWRSVSDSNQPAKAHHCPDISPLESPTAEVQPLDDTVIRPGKVMELAELDGHQVEQENRKHRRLRSKITDFTVGYLPDIEVQRDNDAGMGTLTLSLVFNIFVLSISQLQKFYRQYMDNPYVKSTLLSLLHAVESCFYIIQTLWTAFSIYKATGSWPKPKDKDIGRFLAAGGQALVNLVALGFFMMVIGRLAWYVVLVGSWIVWFAKPFGLIFSIVGRMMLA